MNGCPDCPKLLARAERAKAQAKKLNEDWHQAIKERDHNKRMWDGQINRTALAEARVKELEGSVATLRELRELDAKVHTANNDVINSLRAELAKRDEAGRKLRKYAWHLQSCALFTAKNKCDCGREQALAAAPSEWKEQP